MDATFTQLDEMLRRMGAPVDAAECHGSLCGAICAPAGDVDMWLAQTVDGVAAERLGDARATLERMSADERRRLRGGDMSFTPLLPDDEVPLPQRAGALGEWCEGFLYGIGSARIDEFDSLPPQVQEALRDFVEIARVGIPGGDGDEEDEAAYQELVEYLRVAAQLIHDEFHPAPAPTEVPGPGSVH
jgi:uncharacterized protein